VRDWREGAYLGRIDEEVVDRRSGRGPLQNGALIVMDGLVVSEVELLHRVTHMVQPAGAGQRGTGRKHLVEARRGVVCAQRGERPILRAVGGVCVEVAVHLLVSAE